MVIFFFTNNKRKAEGMRKAFKKYGIKIKIEKNFGIPEIQADTCEEVAEFSAKWTAEKIKKPVLSGDTGLFVEALNGLPGVYTSQFHKKLGIERFMKLLKDETNRNAKLVYALSFCEPNKDPITFSNITEGKITEKVNIVGSFIDSIFIPKGEKEVIGIIRKKDPNKIHMFFGNIEERFARWYVKNKKDLL
ncbi:MAG: non-canonical purine NTP pyrophosphatase [Candidatus Aenigmarchaeota archaeon ex4484_56]|nr:MAG: non-canonical purine NTP pyrophosphatase [Candidatus Aenigmarchaeota archaeon ex4484_56]